MGGERYQSHGFQGIPFAGCDHTIIVQSAISWGRQPGSPIPGELPADQKLRRLADLHHNYGRFDDALDPYHIDIRLMQGIGRTTIAWD